MREITRSKTVEYSVYQTSDGKEFQSRKEAQLHEDKLNGSKKTCEVCGGKGRVNGRYETIVYDYGHSQEERWMDEKCKECNGKGYLELKWM